VWLRRGRTWPDGLSYRPSQVADDCATAIRGLLGNG
jgi:putative hydrolase of the HAD superfamily